MQATETRPSRSTALSAVDDPSTATNRDPYAYLHDLRRHDLFGALKFSLFLPLAQHAGGAPADALAVARLVAVLHEDCGPCAQICVDLSLDAGVRPELLHMVLDGRVDDLAEDLQAVYRLAEATVQARPEAGHLGEAVEARYGRKALAALALAIASVRVFPTVKRALGYARSCSQVRVEVGR